MKNLPRKKIEEAFIGHLCKTFHPADVSPPNVFWCEKVRVEADDYVLDNHSNAIREQRLKGSKHTWISRDPTPLKINPRDGVLVVDIVRDARHGSPDWSAIILFGEQCYVFALQALVRECDLND